MSWEREGGGRSGAVGGMLFRFRLFLLQKKNSEEDQEKTMIVGEGGCWLQWGSGSGSGRNAF